MIELLVVLGIIAVLIGLLFPVIAKARRQAHLVGCMSNLRQLGVALLSYAHDNDGWFPAAAVATAQLPDDWVYWQPGRDPAQGQVYKYLGKRLEVLNCPAGVPDRGPTTGPYGTFPPYPYSYSVNIMFTGYATRPDVPRGRPTAGDYCTLGMVVAPSRKVLAVEEDSNRINDGAWWTDSGDILTSKRYSVSMLHDVGRDYGQSPDDDHYFKRGRGPVVFADGHCDVLDRQTLQNHVYPRQ